MSKIRLPHQLSVEAVSKTLIYGQPGLGKTTLAISSPSPLLLDFDRGVHRVDPKHLCPTVQVESWDDVLDVLNEDLSQYRTLVIDTAGKMLDFMSAYLIKQDPKLGKRDGSLTLPGYGARKSMFVNFLSRVSMMGKHLVFVAHEKEERDGETKIIRPEIGGSSSGDLIKELDLVGYMEAIGKERTISFDPCEKFYAKNTCNLPTVIKLPNVKVALNNTMSTIIRGYQESLKERQQMSADYSEFIELIAGQIQSIVDAKTANEVVEWAKTCDTHIWDSKLQASRMIKVRADELQLVFDRATMAYVDPVKEEPKEQPEAKAEKKSTKSAKQKAEVNAEG